MFIFCVKCVCPHDFYCTLGHSEYTHYLNRTTKPREYNILVHVCTLTHCLDIDSVLGVCSTVISGGEVELVPSSPTGGTVTRN